MITQKLVKSKTNIWQALQEFHNPTDKKPLLKECQVFEETRNNWRDNMSEKVKIFVSEDELIQPMTDIFLDDKKFVQALELTEKKPDEMALPEIKNIARFVGKLSKPKKMSIINCDD